MVVLDQHRIPQPHAVIGRAAHPRRVFFKHAQAGDGLAGVEQGGLAVHGIDIGARHCRDAREVLHGVERAALDGEQSTGVAGDPHQRGARCDALAVLHEHFDRTRRIEMTEERGGQWQTGGGDRLAAVHHPGKARIGRDDALGGDVVAAAREAFAEIFSERSVDKGTKVEAWEGKCIHAVTLQK